MEASQLKTEMPIISPSFNSHSSNKSPKIAPRVVREFAFNDELQRPNDNIMNQDNDNDSEDQLQEFTFNYKPETEHVLTSAEDVFYNGKIMPLYTNRLFDFKTQTTTTRRNVLEKTISTNINTTKNTKKSNRLPLMILFDQENMNAASSSSSSSTSTDLEGLPPGTYCVWSPKEAVEGCEMKSSSTGLRSRRWKLRNLLYRSNSDKKETSVFLAPRK